jgi:hypothetical protein
VLRPLGVNLTADLTVGDQFDRSFVASGRSAGEILPDPITQRVEHQE